MKIKISKGKFGNKKYLVIDNLPIQTWIKWLFLSIVSDPSGLKCKHCGKLNLFFDDCGWFSFPFTCRYDKYKIGCKECFDKVNGKYFSLGER